MTEKYMQLALLEAKKANEKNDVPVGAIIVKNGKIIARAHNQREQRKTVMAHAEILAVEKACRKLKDWRLNGCEIYVTLRPCPMCEAVLNESRIDLVIYGADSNINENNVGGARVIKLNGEVAQECELLLKTFFKNKRK